MSWPTGWGDRLRLSSPVDDLEDLDADRVIVTLPASAASALVAPVSAAAEMLGSIDYASVVLVSLAFDAADIDHPMEGSGYLVPAVEGRTISACSWASSKWSHVGTPETVVLRVSAGRYGDDRALAMDDDTLLGAVRADLAATMDLDAEPQAIRISRWERSLPPVPARPSGVGGRHRAGADQGCALVTSNRGLGSRPGSTGLHPSRPPSGSSQFGRSLLK